MVPPQPDEVYRGVTRVFAVIILVFGITIVTLTLSRGGGIASTGLWIGLLFTGLGAGRFYLATRRA